MNYFSILRSLHNFWLKKYIYHTMKKRGGRVYGQMDSSCMNLWIDGKEVGGWIDRWLNGWKDDRWINKQWINLCIIAWTQCCFHFLYQILFSNTKLDISSLPSISGFYVVTYLVSSVLESVLFFWFNLPQFSKIHHFEESWRC